MINFIDYKDKKIRYQLLGQGHTIVLLHGYLESLDIWEDFAKSLSNDFQVISIDLPGHGKTSVFQEVHTMTFMAEVVEQVLATLNIQQCVIFGHSMGGYALMEYVNCYAERLVGFSLFHSTPFADNELKKTTRDMTILDIKNGKRITVCKEHSPKTFANENHKKFERIIGYAKIIALNTPQEGIIAALEGMKQRTDHAELLANTKLPFLFIHGAKDNFIQANVLNYMKLPINSKVLLLQNSGHQGYLEEPEICLENIKLFVNNCFI